MMSVKNFLVAGVAVVCGVYTGGCSAGPSLKGSQEVQNQEDVERVDSQDQERTGDDVKRQEVEGDITEEDIKEHVADVDSQGQEGKIQEPTDNDVQRPKEEIKMQEITQEMPLQSKDSEDVKDKDGQGNNDDEEDTEDEDDQGNAPEDIEVKASEEVKQEGS